MSKHIITDDDMYDLLVYLRKRVYEHEDSYAEYLIEKLCVVCNKEFTTFIKDPNG